MMEALKGFIGLVVFFFVLLLVFKLLLLALFTAFFLVFGLMLYIKLRDKMSK